MPFKNKRKGVVQRQREPIALPDQPLAQGGDLVDVKQRWLRPPPAEDRSYASPESCCKQPSMFSPAQGTFQNQDSKEVCSADGSQSLAAGLPEDGYQPLSRKLPPGQDNHELQV